MAVALAVFVCKVRGVRVYECAGWDQAEEGAFFAEEAKHANCVEEKLLQGQLLLQLHPACSAGSG